MLTRLVCTFISFCLIFELSHSLFAATQTSSRTDLTVTVLIDPGDRLNRFVPFHAFGAAIDGHEQGEIDFMLSSANIREMLSAGLKPLSYRLRTELAGEAWHWNPRGQWSDAENKRGYWISDSTPGEPILLSYGYRLPRRGNTLDQANNDGYSRLDDGDTQTFWKSNPYLDKHFTGEENSRLAQWVIVDLGSATNVNAIRLLWGAPFATNYEVQYPPLPGGVDVSQRLPSTWQTFPLGKVQNGKGGDVTRRLSSSPIRTRFIRVLLKESSGTAAMKSEDVRDRLGYALREIYVGSIAKGRFHDELSHKANNTQTPIYVSSTDPWHTEKDKDRLTEQPGFDRVYQSGLTNSLPMLTPVPVLYDTPANAAAEVRYLRAHGYPLERVEIGEEPDGQFVSPEHYGALYLQFAQAIHEVDPNLQSGGPSLQDIEPSAKTASSQIGKRNWLGNFLAYLKERRHLDEFNFFSFEWYPFEDVCKPTSPQLLRAADMLTYSLAELEASGLTKNIPWIITEYGYSAFAGRAEIDIEGALLNADVVGCFLALGGDQTFLYGYEPNEILNETSCSWGNNMLFMRGKNGKTSYPMPTFYGAQLLTQEWVKPGNDVHELYRTTATEETDPSPLTAYAVLRPDGLWSVMLINKDPANTLRVAVRFRDPRTGRVSQFADAIDVYQYSREQYELKENGENSHPIRNKPPKHIRRDDGDGPVILAAYSLTIIRGVLK